MSLGDIPRQALTRGKNARKSVEQRTKGPTSSSTERRRSPGEAIFERDQNKPERKMSIWTEKCIID